MVANSEEYDDAYEAQAELEAGEAEPPEVALGALYEALLLPG